MHRSPARWTQAFIAAALLTLPAAAFAQTPPPDTTVDAPAAKQHLTEARDTLSQLTSMPEAAKLQGDARTQVSSLISNFNELITTQADWRAVYAKVDANLATLLGPDSPDAAPPASGVSGAVGTSGASAAPLDPAVRAKLVEFRAHLKEFERSAGGTTEAMTPASPAATTPAPEQPKAAEQIAPADVSRHLDAISAILDQSKTGALTKTETAELKKHVAELRALLDK